VGSLVVCANAEVRSELLAVFRDDMLQTERASEVIHNVPPGVWVEAAELRAPGRHIADRLDVMGVDAAQVLAGLDRRIRIGAGPFDEVFLTEESEYSIAEIREEEALLGAMSAQDWVNRLAATPDGLDAISGQVLGSRPWLLNLIAGWDARHRLRAVLLAFPDAEVIVDITERMESEPESLASESQEAVREEAATHAPMIVLTEGRTDAEFLAAALGVLYPHLTDLVRFLDYERKPDGGVSALGRTVRAFAAAGIANRVVAVFDNDTAGAEGLQILDAITLPRNIRAMCYPALDHAKDYPTLGPPTLEHPRGSAALADVNGLAASIELYLGRDVLTQADGTLYPVQWKAFIPKMSRYQGEVTDKNGIQGAFRVKLAEAIRNPEAVQSQDWEGLRAVLDAILAAFVRPDSEDVHMWEWAQVIIS
jgi:hypothetical protein